jgi:cysteine-rich repeat protein
MNICSISSLTILVAFLIASSGCKDRRGSLDKFFPKEHSSTHNLAEPLLRQTKGLGITPSEQQFFQPEILTKISPEMSVAPPPSPNFFDTTPPPPPVPAPPIPVDDLNGFVEYDGPIYSLCGNGVLNRVVNRIACPAFGPTPIFGVGPIASFLDPCVGFVYIEQCDDGNTFDNDGCSSVCLKECCGNGIVEEGEECDLGQNRGPVLPEISPPADFPIEGTSTTVVDAPDIFTQPYAACSRPDLVTDTANCSRHCQFIICGDGIVNGNEQCDDGNNLSCDGCFKCTLEKPGACPCNCCPEPGVAICNNICCKRNETCNATSNTCVCSNLSCNNICCKPNETCNSSNKCSCANALCPDGTCCAEGEICDTSNTCVASTKM